MPRVTRRSLASKKEEEVQEPPKSGKRGSRKADPVEEPEPIGEPAPSKTSRASSRGKGTTAKEEPPKGRAPSRGRGKKQEEPEEEIEEKESPAPKRGRGRGKKDDQEEKVEEAPVAKRGARGGRGKKEEVPEEDDEEELPPPPKKQARGGRGKKEEEEPPKRASRGGRAKKDEQEESEEVDIPTPEKAAPKGRGRSGRGSRGAQSEDVNEAQEPEEEEATPKGRQAKTPPSGGRRGRGKKHEVSPAKEETAVEKEESKEQEDDVEEKAEEPPKLEEQKPEEQPQTEETEEKSPGITNMDSESNDDDAEEKMQVEPEEVKKADPPATEEQQTTGTEFEVGKKRKLEDEDNEVLSSPKKARISESSQEMPADNKNEDSTIASDFVVVNKEDVPAADSKEVEAALPPLVEEEEQEPAEMEAADVPMATTDKMAAPSTVVPLTEAELAKQYNPTIRDRDDNSSMMVEIGSEAASDVGSVSRNLDISEMGALDQPGADDSMASSDISETTSTSKQVEPSIVSNDIPQPPAVQSTPVVEMAAIPLPSDKSPVVQQQKPQTQQPTATPPQSSAPAPVSNPPSAPTPVAALPAVPPVQVNSIPMPPNFNMSNSSSDTPSAPSSQPVQNATAQNGACKPNEHVAQSLPVHTSTPAKKPIAFDSSYVPSSPSITQRKFISNRSFPIELMDPAFCFSVVSYNILADCHLRRYDYSYTEAQYLELTYRHSLFLKELDYLDGDIVCMQEVDTKYYSDVLLPSMTSRGYQGMFKKRTQDWYDEGEATFVKTSKFEVLSYDGMSLKDLAYEEIEVAGLTGDVSRAAKKYLDRADVVLVCKLLSKRTGKHLTVGNIHVAFDPKAPDVQCIQVASAVKELVSKAGSDLNPYIICGDFNSETTSPAYQLAKDGYLTDEHIRVLQNIQSMDNTEGTSRSIIHYLWKAFQHTSSNMKSAYETSVGREPVITSLNGLVKACLDYIFYSSSTLYTVGAMEIIDPQVIEATGGLPSKDIPSDHLSVKAVFRLKD